MKTIIFFLFTLVIGRSMAQSLDVSASIGYYDGALSKITRSDDSLRLNIYPIYSPTFSLRFVSGKNWFCGLSFSIQNEIYDGSEGHIGAPNIEFSKYTYAKPLAVDLGYCCRIRSSGFNFFTSLSYGFARVTGSLNANKDHSNVHQVPLSNPMIWDTVVYVQHADDSFQNGCRGQMNGKIGAEFQVHNLFFLFYAEARTWLRPISEVRYSGEYSSSYSGYQFTSNGWYSVRTGYVGFGIGIGYKFDTSRISAGTTGSSRISDPGFCD